MLFTLIISQHTNSHEFKTGIALTKQFKSYLEGLDYELDSYDNLVVTMPYMSLIKLDRIKRVQMAMAKHMKNYGFFLSIPLDYAEWVKKLEKVGFEFFEYNYHNRTVTLLWRNGRPIPTLNYAYTSVSVCLLKREKNNVYALALNEKEKRFFTLPGGILKVNENPNQGIVRFVKNQISCNVKPESLKLVAVYHSVRPDRKTSVDFLFATEEFSGELKLGNDTNVLEMKWVPFDSMKKEGFIAFNKPLIPLWKYAINEKQAYRAEANERILYKTFFALPLK